MQFTVLHPGNDLPRPKDEGVALGLPGPESMKRSAPKRIAPHVVTHEILDELHRVRPFDPEQLALRSIPVGLYPIAPLSLRTQNRSAIRAEPAVMSGVS